jgi:hypothetical protein
LGKTQNTKTAEQDTEKRKKRAKGLMCARKSIRPSLSFPKKEIPPRPHQKADHFGSPAVHVMIMMLFPFVPCGEIKMNSSRPGVLYPLPRHANRTEQWTLPLKKKKTPC